MKSIYLLALLLSAFCLSSSMAGVIAPNAPVDNAELKLSLSTQAINKLVAFLGDMIDNLSGGAPLNIPLKVDIKGKLNLYKIQLNNFILANHTINWNQDAISIVAVTDNVFKVDINKISLNFTGYEDIEFLYLIKIKNNFTLTITDLTFSTTVTLKPTADDTTIGFTAKLTKSSLNMSHLQLVLQDQKIWNNIAKPFVWLIKELLGPVLNLVIQPFLNKQIEAFCAKPLSPDLKIGQYTYQFNINFPQGITQKQDDLRIPVNIKQITNLNSTDIAPVSQKVDIPDYYFTNHTNRYDLEILLGTGIINQLIWTVADSKLLSITISQSSAIMQNIPLQLNLQGVQLLLPGLYNEYSVRRKMPPTTGVYLQVQVPQQTPDVRLVAGRLVGTLNASLRFLVELNPDEYPVADIKQCECDEALNVDVTIYFAADIYTPGSFKIGANVSNLQVVSSTKVSGAIDFDGAKFSTNASLLIYNIVGIINQQLSQGVDIPLVSQASFLQDITLIFEQGYILIDVGINPNN